jgi:peptidoglycan hydrolase-like protein with peptidoglycan-binding domain
MREAFTFDHHPEHAWLHFAIRLSIVLLLLFLFLILTENSLGKLVKQEPATAELLEAEQRLSGLGYWTGPIDGIFDSGSKHAFIAFQKIEGRRRTGKLTPDELEALRSAARPQPRESSYSHIEVDLTRQVLMFVDDQGQASRILPVCTGSDELYLDEGKWARAHTPRGRFIVNRKIEGWRLSRLGLLYYPNYIVNGIAIHGSLSIKTYAASHGCIRIPMFAAKEVGEMTPVGTIVVVYDG